MTYQQQLARIKTTGNYNPRQMKDLISAIKAEPSGMSATTILALIYNKILQGKDFQLIIDWLSIR